MLLWSWLFETYHKLASPKAFYTISQYCIPVFGLLALGLLLIGSITGLFFAPADYQQGDSARIIYIHVPAAWLSLFIYVIMASAAAIGLIWRIKMALYVMICSAPIGATMTIIALITGSIWGAPIWGTWWEWDARLTSELILLFLYFGIMALYSAFDEVHVAQKATAILTIVGLVIIPIIHYSVQWWNSLHQGATVFRAGGAALPTSMLIPLLFNAIGLKFYYAYTLFIKLQHRILWHQKNTEWVSNNLHSLK